MFSFATAHKITIDGLCHSSGHCVVEHFNEPLLYQGHSGSPIPRCAILAGPITVTSSNVRSSSPPIYLHREGVAPYVLEGKHRTTSPTYITTLTLDQSPPSAVEHALRLVVFYDSGEFCVFSIDHSAPQQSKRIGSFLPSRKSERTAPIRQASYHHPLLVTLSHSFHLSLYNLSDSTIVHTQTLSSFTSFPPTSMVLTPGPQSYRLIMAYSAPVFPNHWSAAVTVLNISPAQPSNTHMASFVNEDNEEVKPCSVTSSRTVRSWDIPSGWIDEKALRVMREQWGRKVARVADTQTDGKWVVLAPSDRLPLAASSKSFLHSKFGSTACALQLYRLHLPLTNNPSASAPRMTFVRMLYGHTGPVVALSLADGRCVSLGADGSIWVWDLEKAWGVEVQEAHHEISLSSHDENMNLDVGEDIPMGTPQGTVVFDERRIVSADSFGLEARRFDI